MMMMMLMMMMMIDDNDDKGLSYKQLYILTIFFATYKLFKELP